MHAVVWKNQLPTDLGNLGGALNNVAYAINNRGQVVGASDLAGDNTGHGFFWQNGVITDLGTLPGDFSSFAFSINDRGQVVGQSCDVNFNCRAFLWQNGVMTDLNSLAVASPLYLIAAADISSRGEIVGTGLDENTGEPLAFVAAPCDLEPERAEGCEISASDVLSVEKPKIVLPENVREQLRHRSGFSHFAAVNTSGVDLLKEPLGMGFGLTANSCRSLGSSCTSSNVCCTGSFCGRHRTCCDKPYYSQSCTSSAECCNGLCLNHRCQ
jgi:probable HAF family extracellular repeat protein